MNPSTELKARVLAATGREPSPNRQTVLRRAMGAWLVAFVSTLAVFLVVGGVRAVERPLEFVLGTAAGWAGIALAATWTCARRGSMLGRSLVVLLLSAVTTPVALGTWHFVAVRSLGYKLGPASPISCALACLGVSIALAAGPFAVSLLRRRATDPTHPRAAAASVGVVAGAWTGVLMDLHCERADLLHVAIGHVAPALFLGLVGVLLGDWLLGVHAETNWVSSRGR
jgi:hypothetical protein